MNESFSADVASSLGDGRDRAGAAALAMETAMPSVESEEWRYSPIGDLQVDEITPVTSAPGADGLDAAGSGGFDDVVSTRSATAILIDGFVVSISVDPGWAAKGLSVEADPARTARLPEGSLTAFDHLHQAFSPAALTISVPEGLAVTEPVVIISHSATVGGAGFSHICVESGPGSEISVVERQTSAEGLAVSVPVVELTAGPASQLRYVSIQENGRDHWQLGRQVSSIDAQATVTSGLAVFGGRYARTRTDSRLIGRGGTANLIAAYYGDGEQTHDFRTFQHHEARDTRSDLLFKGSQDDASGSIYTGMIHIHPDGAGTNAFQTNRNVKLSDDAWAWSVPNLEIENNDVHCSHASTVSPVDGDQQFYLHARGVPPATADRLIVAGFFDEAIQRLPVPAARGEVRRLVKEKLDRRMDQQ